MTPSSAASPGGGRRRRRLAGGVLEDDRAELTDRAKKTIVIVLGIVLAFLVACFVARQFPPKADHVIIAPKWAPPREAPSLAGKPPSLSDAQEVGNPTGHAVSIPAPKPAAAQETQWSYGGKDVRGHGFTVTEWRGRWGRLAFTVVGEIVNNNPKPMSIWLKFVARDKNGRVLSVEDGMPSTDNLPPGKMWAFEFPVWTIHQVEPSEIASMEVSLIDPWQD